MKRIKSALRRLVKTLMVVGVLIGGGVFGMYKARVDIPALNTTKLYAHLDIMGVRAEHWKVYIVGQYEKYFHKDMEEVHHEEHKIVVTSPLAQDVTIKQEYVCQIHSRKHINVCALENGYLKEIKIREGQAVKEGEVMFEVVPILYKARLDTELAEMNLAELELKFSRTLAANHAVSPTEVGLFEAKLAKAKAKAELARAELGFASVKAAFDGIIDRLQQMQGSLVKEGEILTTLSDNSVMWVYFNVTEKRYLEYMAEAYENNESTDIVLPNIILMLANHREFPHRGTIDQTQKIGAIESNFNNQTGNLSFRADVPNPERLLRHGQTGTVVINREFKGAIVIPQRATFENLAKRYVYIVDKDDVVHQKEIVIEHELEDIFVIEKGILTVDDKIIIEGVRQVREGEKVESEFRKPEEVMKDLKNPAQ
jgi:membrane fusion protein, multidrug efflux system